MSILAPSSLNAKGLSVCIYFRAFSLLMACFCLGATQPAYGQFFRGTKEFRTINTEIFEVSMQKNGQTDIKFPSGEPIFENVCPLVVFEGEDDPTPLPVDARYTTRIEVNDRLGKGHGFLYSKKNCAWTMRVYPTKPFLTAQVVFFNTSKKPVRVSKLIPWSVGVNKTGAAVLGPGTSQAAILENGRLFKSFNDYAEVVHGKSSSQWNLAVLNPATGRSFIAGFLTNARAYTQVRMEQRENAPDNAFDLFQAECVFDPPVEVPPDGKLESEVFYVSVAEANPLIGLDRYGKAYAVWNGVHDERPFMPHGWDSWNTSYHTDIDETKMLENLDVVDKNLKRYGWEHFAIDAGWERGLADWEPNPERFPHGMKYMADEIHRRGMTAGIWIDLFTIPKDSALAKEHPDWMAPPHALGRIVMGTDNWILDVTVPGAYEYAKETCRKIGQDWGFDALMEVDFVYHLMLAEKYSDASKTRIEVIRMGLQAVREGFGENKFIDSMTPQPVVGTVANGVRMGRDCAPIWRCDNRQNPWGAVDSLTNAIRKYYFAPHLHVLDQDCAYFGHESTRKRWNAQAQPPLTPTQSLAWLTGAAMTGGIVKIGDAFAELNADELGVLRKLLPSTETPAYPLDLFQEDSPAIWLLPIKAAAGEWHIAGLFNWDENKSKTVTLPLNTLGLNPAKYYTVFDFWQEQYCGTAKGRLDVAVPPGSVRLFGLRKFEEHPMFLATDRHFTQGALDHKSIEWDASGRQLRGVFEAVADTDYTLRILIPEGYALQQAAVSAGGAQTIMDERVLKIQFHNAAAGNVEWSAQF